MKKALLALAAFVALGLLPVTSALADGRSDEASFVTQINTLRGTKGLPALQVDAGLTQKARAWAQTMADKNMIWHSDFESGITADWQRLGENVGMGGSVDSLHVAFVNSPEHYENLVDPAFGFVGVGVVRSASGLIFVAEEFMQLRAPVVTSVAPVVPTPEVPAPTVETPPAVKLPSAPKAPVVVVKAPPSTRPVVFPAPPAAAEAPASTPLRHAPPNVAVSAPAVVTRAVRETRVPLGGSVRSQRWASAL